MEPTQLGPYRIGQRIGKGGMGAVYEGVDDASGDTVAVKALSPQLAAAEGFRERFESEIESLKKLEHDGIVRMYGYGEDDGVLFYSMERVAGPSLEEEIRSGRRFDWRETLSIAVQVCRALKHAHDHGIVHRDIKPANILIAGDGKVKLADFGIARLFGATQLTTAGGVLGTADYMSPEQADGRPVTDKCDQYALGCVMYALLAGRPPFRAKTMPEMLQLQRFADPEPVRRYAPDTPQQLDDLIQQLLSKDPQDRFPNVMVLARHMEAMIRALSRPKSEPPPAEPGAVKPFTQGNVTAAAERDATLSGDAISLITVQTGDEGLYDAPTLAEEDLALIAPASTPAAPVKPLAAPPLAAPPLAAEPRPTRFTTVAEDARRAARSTDEVPWSHWLSLAGLALALVGLAYAGWRITRPLSADELYDEVMSAVAQDGPQGLRNHRDDIATFLVKYPDDARAPEFEKLNEELKLLGVATRMRVGSRIAGGDAANPASQWYGAAMALSDADPAAAIAMLDNALRLYGFDPRSMNELSFDDADLGLDDQQMKLLRVIDLERKRLRDRLAEAAAAQRPQLAERLAAARKLATKRPAEAKRIYQGLVDLYTDVPWANDLVQDAARALQALEAESHQN